MVTTSAPHSVLCKETYSTDLMNSPGSRSHGFQYICWSETVPRPHPARMPAGCDRQVCGDLLSPHDDSPAQAPAAGPPSPLQTCGLPHSWCVCQVLSDGGALASRDAGQRPTSPRSLPQRTPRASTRKGATPAVALHLSDDRAGKSLTTQGAGPAPQQPGGRARGTHTRLPEPRQTCSVWRFPFSSGHFQTSIHRRVVRVNVLPRSSSSRVSLLGAVSHPR